MDANFILYYFISNFINENLIHQGFFLLNNGFLQYLFHSNVAIHETHEKNFVPHYLGGKSPLVLGCDLLSPSLPVII